MKRGMLAYVMIIIITVIGLVNFFAPFFTEYKTDPIITYAFLGVAATIAGFKGVGQGWLRRVNGTLTRETQEEKE